MDAERVPPGAWRFDRFTLDLGRRALLGPDGAEVPLRPKSFALLRLLVENPGRVVDRDAIMAAVWPDVVVGDESITQCVRDIRKALGGEVQQVLKTVARHGYLLAAEVVPAETTAPVPRVERRLAAILAADVVGYSRLIEADEAGTLAAIRALREGAIDPLLAEHKGRIVKLMGDGAIVEFASVVDAVACAVAVQKAVADRQAKTPPDRRIVFRIGVNLGDVVVEGDDLLGDGVNVAARLEQLCEPGGVLVSGTAYDHLQGRLGLPLEFTGEQQVKNIARPVRAYRVRLDGTAMRDLRGRQVWRLSRRAVAAALALILLVAAAAGGWWWRQAGEPAGPPLPDAPSIAVLPFDNMGGDEETGRLADGLTEDTITDLARYRDLDVIARNSTAVYKDKPVDVRQIGRDLNVRYVLEGSIQRQDTRVRITAQLIDARTATHLWTERWDRPAEDVFAVQAEVAEQVSNALGGHSVLLRESTAAAKRKRPADLAAYDLWALSTDAFLRGKEADLVQGVAYTDAAIAQDPSLARAYTRKAWLLNGLTRYKNNFGEAIVEMESLARTAIDIDPYDAEGYLVLAYATSSLGRNAEAMAATERALDLNPSSAGVLNTAAQNMAYFGKPEEGAKMCDRSFKLNPHPPAWYDIDCVENYFFTERYRDAVESTGRWSKHADLPASMLVYRAASQAEFSGAETAAAAVEELRQRFPDVSFEYLMNTGWIFERKQEEERILASTRKAGVRICATGEELKAFDSPRRLPECAAMPSDEEAAGGGEAVDGR